MKNPNAFIAKDGVSDANLIFAARDLYETLRAVDATLSGVDGRLAAHVRRVISPALAKARGES
jgi:hypothetical protein